MDILLLIAGGALLYFGGELLVTNAVRLASTLGLSPMVIGLTVVSVGTSTPELSASIVAAWGGSADMALGNVTGSNTANIGLILGAAALVRPLRAQGRFLRRELPYLVAMCGIMWTSVWGGLVSRTEGLLLLGCMVLFLVLLLRSGRAEDPEVVEDLSEVAEDIEAKVPWWWATPLLFAGIALLIFGADLFVEGASNLARQFGVSERVIGLTLVAFGTSLPELASSTIAAWRNQADIVVGNVIGSNIFNIVLVLGATAVVHPMKVDAEAVFLDLAVMVAFIVLAWGMLITNLLVERWEGGVLLTLYVLYIGMLFVS